MRYSMVKNSITAVLILIFTKMAAAQGLYEDYQSAAANYKAGSYVNSVKILEEIITEYPDYIPAKLLYYKASYSIGDAEKNDFMLKQILNSSENEREELLNFFIEKDDIVRAEEVYKQISKKEEYRYKIAELLYRKKMYSKIIREYPEKKIISLIEKDKNKADSYYFKAMELLKRDNSKVAQAQELLEEAVKIYPVNYIYYYKLGQMYADSKNFYLAEYNLRKALEYNESKEIYLNLFRLYAENNEYEMIYRTAPYVIEYPEVKLKLQEMYAQNKRDRNSIRVSKADGNLLYIEKSMLPKLNIGDAFFIEKKSSEIFDKISGEKLYEIREKVCKVRVYNLEQKVAVLYITESYLPLNISEDYLITN